MALRLRMTYDGLQEKVGLLFDERNQVVVADDDQHALTRVPRLIRVGQNIEQAARGANQYLNETTAIARCGNGIERSTGATCPTSR